MRKTQLSDIQSFLDSDFQESMQEAREAGRRFYKSGSYCKNQHLAVRHTNSMMCVQCKLKMPPERATTELLYLEKHWLLRAKEDPIMFWCAYTVTRKRRTCKDLNIPFDLDPEYLRTLYVEKCPVFGLNLLYRKSSTRRTGVLASYDPNQASLDRIDPKGGYVKGNVAIISRRANAIKNDASAEDLRRVAAWLEQLGPQ